MPDVVEKFWHFWVGDAGEGGHIIDHVFCMTRANWHDKTREGMINVTINADEVTCQNVWSGYMHDWIYIIIGVIFGNLIGSWIGNIVPHVIKKLRKPRVPLAVWECPIGGCGLSVKASDIDALDYMRHKHILIA